jgi:cytochrome P450
VTRYEDAWTALTDPRFTRVWIFGWADEAVDTPKHLVWRAFTPRRIATSRPWVVSVIAELVDALIDTGPPADLVARSRRRCRCG